MIQVRGMQSLSINKGQYVHREPAILYALCTNGRKVSRVHSGKVYFRDEEGHEHFVKMSSVLFVCDTEEESHELDVLSRQQRESIAAAVNTIQSTIMRTLKSICNQEKIAA